MAFKSVSGQMIPQALSDTSTTQKLAIGQVVRAIDPILGGGEFIYLKGVASTVVSSVVTYDLVAGTTVLAPSTANLAQPLAVSMSANVANQYGFYQISGLAVAATNGTLSGAGVPVYLAGTGQVTSTQANGKQVVGATSSSATGTPATAQAYVTINRPFAQGQAV